jgi:hypothetical protein
MHIECTKNLCSDKCANQRIQNHEFKLLEIKHADKKGYGAYALEKIKKGEFIIEYIGELLNTETMKSRLETDSQHFYMFDIGKGMYIDASRQGNESRFLNHSCDPNVCTQRWSVFDRPRIAMFALRDIEVGQELTFDYAFENLGDNPQKCYCGAEKCRGTLAKVTKKKTPKKPKKLTKDEISEMRGQRFEKCLEKMINHTLTPSKGVVKIRGRKNIYPQNGLSHEFQTAQVWNVFLVRNIVKRKGDLCQGLIVAKGEDENEILKKEAYALGLSVAEYKIQLGGMDRKSKMTPSPNLVGRVRKTPIVREMTNPLILNGEQSEDDLTPLKRKKLDKKEKKISVPVEAEAIEVDNEIYCSVRGCKKIANEKHKAISLEIYLDLERKNSGILCNDCFKQGTKLKKSATY